MSDGCTWTPSNPATRFTGAAPTPYVFTMWRPSPQNASVTLTFVRCTPTSTSTAATLAVFPRSCAAPKSPTLWRVCSNAGFCNLYILVLPYRSRSGKLTFPLCRSCVEEGVNCVPCEHKDESERALLGTWVTAELDKAVMLGYRILDKYEAWHYDVVKQYDPRTRSGGVWSEFIDNWVRLKMEDSGFPRDMDQVAAYIRRV